MMTKNLQRKIKTTGLVLSLAVGFLLMSNVTVNAQYGNDDYYRRQEQRQRQAERQARREQRRTERDNGYYGNNGGYNRNDGYYGNGDYNNVYRYAQQNGYRDGINKGSEEASRNKRYNPQGTSTYKNATSGYNGRYGNKDAYKQAYRQAFLDGYDRGYNQNDRYGNRNDRYNRRNSAGSIIERIIRGY